MRAVSGARLTRRAAPPSRVRRAIMALAVLLTVATLACPPRTATADPLPAEPAALADTLVAAEQTLHSGAAEPVLADAAHRQQVAYRTLGRHPEWDVIARPRIPASFLGVYDRNIDAYRQLSGMTEPKTTLPAWRIEPPTPAGDLLGDYRSAEAATGVGWNYLAAINLVETRFGRIASTSDAGAQGPMQFMPSTFAAYGGGGDILSPHDSILAAGRYLAANNFAGNPDGALYHYNHSDRYVRAVTDYATVLAADPAAFTGYYHWDVYYPTTAGDVLLPIGYVATSRIPAADYLASHPQ